MKTSAIRIIDMAIGNLNLAANRKAISQIEDFIWIWLAIDRYAIAQQLGKIAIVESNMARPSNGNARLTVLFCLNMTFLMSKKTCSLVAEQNVLIGDIT